MEAEKECGICGGNGTIRDPQRSWRLNMEYGIKYIPCPSCNGTGLKPWVMEECTDLTIS